MKLIVCDLDGTLCDCRHREHLVPDWDAFQGLIHEDLPHSHVVWFLKLFIPSTVVRVVFLTGRPEMYRGVTTKWLADCCDFFEHDDYDLLMRAKGETGSDVDIKIPMLENFLMDPDQLDQFSEPVEKKDILVLEDRDKVVARWRDAGYECWQVREGAW